MLTDQQLTETALRLIDTELDYLARYDRTAQIGELLCEHHCTAPDCGHDAVESSQEMREVHRQIKDAVAYLRVTLAQYGAARQITITAATRP
jgi:hypothetical protein